MDTEIKPSPAEEKPEEVKLDTPAVFDGPFAPAAAPAKRRNIWIYMLPVAFALGLVVGYFAFAYPLRGQLNAAAARIAALEQAAAGAGAAQAAEMPQKVTRYDIPTAGDPGTGPEDAPIVIVEFSDYECPYCQKWHAEVWPQIQSKYGDQVRLVYRDFPLSGMHPNASPAALAANCAEDQGRYWEFHSALFSGKYPLSTKSYIAISNDLGMDGEAFAACFDSQKYKDEIEEDYQFAAQLGIQSTPTFFINGLAVVGAQPFEMFDQVITMELNGEIPLN